MQVNNFKWTNNAIRDWIDIWAVLWASVPDAASHPPFPALPFARAASGDHPFQWVWSHGDKYVLPLALSSDLDAHIDIHLAAEVVGRMDLGMRGIDPIPLPEIDTIKEISYLMDHYGLIDIKCMIQNWGDVHHWRSSMIQQELDLD